MDFDEAYAAYRQRHIERRTGERKGRLVSRNDHAERLFLKNVWWPLKGNLDHMHPEYEISDWRGRPYYADNAYAPPLLPVFLWEVKGYSKHIRDMDRNGFSNELNREFFLQGIGFRLASFAYDDVAERPETLIYLLRLFLSQFQTDGSPVRLDVLAEKEIIRFALFLAQPFRPVDVSRHLGINYRTTMKYIDRLLAKRWINPVAGKLGERVVRYELVQGVAFHL